MTADDVLKKDCQMTEHEPVLTKLEIFVQGFFLRLSAGLAGAGVLALCVPRLVVDHHSNWVMATAVYSLICIAGGIKDAKTPRIEDTRLFRKITRKRFLLAVLSLLLFAYLISTMK